MIERVIILMLVLVVLYLLLANTNGFNSVVTALGKVNLSTLGVLQGRGCIDALGVKIGCAGPSTDVDVIFD